jgi:predicted RNase H-like HicB family nuclease
MRQARYEILGDQTFYGEIPGLDGVFANAATLEECREQLREVLEVWIILGLRMGHRIPELNGRSLSGDFSVV